MGGELGLPLESSSAGIDGGRQDECPGALLHVRWRGIDAVPLPPGYELQFAVAVVQIDSPGAVANVEVSDFALFDIGNKVTRLKRVVQVEVFDRPHVATGGSFADYLNAGGTQVLERNSARGADPPPCAGRTHRRTHCSGAIPAYGRPEGH